MDPKIDNSLEIPIVNPQDEIASLNKSIDQLKSDQSEFSISADKITLKTGKFEENLDVSNTTNDPKSRKNPLKFSKNRKSEKSINDVIQQITISNEPINDLNQSQIENQLINRSIIHTRLFDQSDFGTKSHSPTIIVGQKFDMSWMMYFASGVVAFAAMVLVVVGMFS